MNYEANNVDLNYASKSNEILSDEEDNKNFIVKQDSIKILYFSNSNFSTQPIFDSISCQLNPNWELYRADDIEEILDYICQGKINLILIYQTPSLGESLYILADIGLQIDAPIITIVDRENEAIATSALSIGAQDYITLEELQNAKILQRTIQHALVRHRWKIQQNELPQIVQADRGDRRQAKTDLEDSEERFRLLSECVPFGIFQTDLSGKPVYTNAYLQNFCQLNSEIDSSKSWIENLHPDDRAYLQNIGALESGENFTQSWMRSIHPDDRGKVLQSFENFIQGMGSFHGEFRLIRSQEDIRWVLGHGIPLEQPNGELIGYVGTITDITVHKQAEENLNQLNVELENRVFERTSDLQQSNLELRIGNKIREFHEAERQRAERALYKANDQLQAVLDAVPGCVAWVSADMYYLGVNQLMAKTFQLEVKDFVGEKVGFIKSSTDEYISFARHFFAGSKDNASQELEFNFSKGTQKHYLLIAQKYAKGQAAVFVAIEITERKRAEIETQNALEKVKELSELKSRFIFMVSHEFRTPLTSIFTASELLEHYGHKWSQEKVLQYLKQIQESVQRMNGLLEDVLLIGAGEVGKLKLQPTDLDIVDFCQHLIEEVQLSRQNRHFFNFAHDTQTRRVMIDAKLLRHILTNLLSNSIKYSPEENPIDLNLWVNSTQISFQVVDYGIGIPLDDQAHLFELFHRATNVGTIGGTGIGLSIVKKSVDALGGSISFESNVNAGSKFTVSIPIHQVQGEYQW
jgi:signal transduction histidine kinase